MADDTQSNAPVTPSSLNRTNELLDLFMAGTCSLEQAEELFDLLNAEFVKIKTTNPDLARAVVVVSSLFQIKAALEVIKMQQAMQQQQQPPISHKPKRQKKNSDSQGSPTTS